jgi:hypothetical protein
MVRLGPIYAPCRPLYRAFESEPTSLRSRHSTGYGRSGTSAAPLPRHSHRACHDGAIRHPRPCAGCAAASRSVPRHRARQSCVLCAHGPTAGAASRVTPACGHLVSSPRVLRSVGCHGRRSPRRSVAGHGATPRALAPRRRCGCRGGRQPQVWFMTATSPSDDDKFLHRARREEPRQEDSASVFAANKAVARRRRM